MSHCPQRKAGLPWHHAFLVFVGVLALVSSRLAVPNFTLSTAPHPTFKSAKAHDKKQFVERYRADLSTSGFALQRIPRPAVAHALVRQVECASLVHLRAFHYNRPPPLA